MVISIQLSMRLLAEWYVCVKEVKQIRKSVIALYDMCKRNNSRAKQKIWIDKNRPTATMCLLPLGVDCLAFEKRNIELDVVRFSLNFF